MTCERKHEELAAFAAGDLDPESAAALKGHLEGCAVCARRLAAIRETDARLKLLPRLRPSAGAMLRTRRALNEELRARPAPEVMTLEEAAAFLRVEPDDLREAASQLPAFEIGGRIRIRREKLIDWIARRERVYARSTAESDVAHILSGIKWEVDDGTNGDKGRARAVLAVPCRAPQGARQHPVGAQREQGRDGRHGIRGSSGPDLSGA